MSFSDQEIRKFQGLSGPIKLVLGYVWQAYWRFVVNGGFRNLNTKPRNPKRSWSTFRMLRSLRRFNANLDPDQLNKAIAEFFKLNFDAPPASDARPSSVVIMGWREDSSFPVASRDFLSTSASVIRVFRPDVAFLRGQMGLVWSGFRIEIASSPMNSWPSEVDRFLKELMQVQTFHIDSVTSRVNQTEDDRGIVELFVENPAELSQLIEATNSKDLALATLEAISSSVDLFSDSGVRLAAAKLALVAGEMGHKFASKFGFEVVSRTEIMPMAIKVPVPSVARVANVALQDGDTLLRDNCLLEFDPVQNPSFDFVAGKWDCVVGTHLDNRYAAVATRKTSSKVLEDGILLSSRADSNWFHWLIETLPRVVELDAQIDPSIPFVISDSIPDTAKESISLISQRKIIEIDRHTRHIFNHLFVPGPVLFHPDSPFFWMGPKFNLVNRDLLLSLRHIVLDAVSASESWLDFERIFIPRENSNRSLLNRGKVSTELETLGFRVISLGSLSFREQVQLFNRAKIIVFEGGAAMSNLIFCSPGARIYVLVGEALEKYRMPSIIGELAGASVQIITGRESRSHINASFMARIHSSYKISAKKLMSVLAR